MSKRNVLIRVGVVVLAVLWYAFRPELLFINKTVNEEFPGGAMMASGEKGPMADSAHGTPSNSASSLAEATCLRDGTMVWSRWMVTVHGPPPAPSH